MAAGRAVCVEEFKDVMQVSRTAYSLAALLMATAPVAATGARAADPAPAAGPTVNAGAIGADLNLSPKRVVFDAATHSATVYVFNQGGASGVYSVTLADEVMLPDGRIIKVEDAAADPANAALAARMKSAKDLMMVTPRRITLAPHESQTIRIRVHPTADGAPGEYRAHLVISALPPEDTGLTADQASGKSDTNLSVRVIALYSLAIPLIVRQGPVDAKGHMDHLSVGPEDDHSAVQVDLMREGTNSIFGDVEVRVSGPKGALLGAVNGVGVYPEVDHRHLKVSLTRKVTPGEHLTVTWRDQDLKPGALIGSSDITAP